MEINISGFQLSRKWLGWHSRNWHWEGWWPPNPDPDSRGRQCSQEAGVCTVHRAGRTDSCSCVLPILDCQQDGPSTAHQGESKGCYITLRVTLYFWIHFCQNFSVEQWLWFTTGSIILYVCIVMIKVKGEVKLACRSTEQRRLYHTK